MTSISTTTHDLGSRSATVSALGRRGINRAGYFVMPMDETLAVAAIDSADGLTPCDLKVKRRVGDLQTELVHDFFEGSPSARAPTCTSRCARPVEPSSRRGGLQGVCALRVACSKDKRLAKVLPSTKGLL